MVYAPQRRHVVVSLSSTMQALALVQHLYAPNIMVLICRVVSHINIRAPAIIQPTRSLFGLFFLVLLTNAAAVLLHLVDFAGGQHGPGKGLVLDFVGQANAPSFTRIMLLDVAIFFLQLSTLVVSYVTSYTPTLPKSDHFPYDDLLLPPAAPLPIAEADLDVESGDQFQQRRHGKGPRYRSVPEGEVWFDEDEEDDPLLGAAPQGRVFPDVSRTRGRRTGDAPLILNVSASHLLSLVFRLPNPIPPRLFSGGTPNASPPLSPTAQDSLRTMVNMLSEAQARAEAAAANDRAPATVNPSANRTPSPDAEEESESRSPSRTRIPGDYWTSRAAG